MTVEFEDIKITGIDTTASGGGDGRSALVDVVLTLSKSPPADWTLYFNSRWEQHIYMMKRRARVSGGRLTIHCVPDELEKDHLPELRKIANETNQRYKTHLAQKERDDWREQERADAQKAEIDKLNNIKFD
ncbi:hypothetical protein ACS8E6_06365 [Salinicola halophyticus]|uniref:hypothetical protein n=1 Tax=Salinicola halophyticus TaxID=1808881 RepID=UPI003F4539D6